MPVQKQISNPAKEFAKNAEAARKKGKNPLATIGFPYGDLQQDVRLAGLPLLTRLLSCSHALRILCWITSNAAATYHCLENLASFQV